MENLYLTTATRTLWPYKAILHANGDIEWDIRPILYDTASITLLDATKSYALCYKEARILGGRNVAYVDVVDAETGFFFSLQVSNIYYFGVFEWIPHIIAKVWDTLVYFENFWKKEVPVEPDGDKSDLTPLGAYDMFISYDTEYYYPLIFSKTHRDTATVQKFFDYYGYQSYTDINWWEHFVLFIEDTRSTEASPYWYFVDNFQPISENIVLPSDEYVETWKLDPYGNILFEVTSWAKYHVDKDWNMQQWWENVPKSSNFSYIREFEDTDADEIIAKNDNGYFIINRNKKEISLEEQKHIVYFKNFVWALSPSEANSEFPYFLMMQDDDQIVLVDHNSNIIAGTDLKWEYEYKSASIQDSVLTVDTDHGVFSYIIVE